MDTLRSLSQHPWLRRIPEGVLLASVTGLGYFSAYLSDVGYKAHFGIPSLFVEISLNAVVLAVCINIFTLIVAYLSLAASWFRSYGKWLFPFLIPAAITILIILKTEATWNKMNVPTMILFYFFHAGLLFLFFHLAHKKARATQAVSLLFLAIAMVTTGYSSGQLIAQNQQTFMVSPGDSGESDWIVIDTYKDALVIAPFDSRTRTVKPEYHFVHLESDRNEELFFTMKRVGPLRLANGSD
ncbi:hypothetical protein [Desmospora profundinema]|uniref:Heme/copper-type cytochrome/quinol oxidase subunit 4 n=1 Tax=Desmospora profundinema TaxID=1571184 RepID=A0ABU1IRQ4_9BACL|nr:hypothetical protein [Desmospora profundinema]MDR6227430.1 heme/copper-type cytochrome/quinol oxidase subunit 4 [Desmospora profundinema]